MYTVPRAEKKGACVPALPGHPRNRGTTEIEVIFNFNPGLLNLQARLKEVYFYST